ncbi:Gfo/Idh/MocA family oxidoreductase [Paenibacillus sp. HB172176]|uniref:Gfo/Idh/MocA family protein n=1 Tax=Paenibacillus sp. HB172176 TaxID=2493690 RepID=UPI00143B246B|nr:Gfo/Idh/MocA family oxidoreductase [Paenibacillus sp. HB172176]
MTHWKIGVVGAGWWSEKHLSAWSRIPQVEIEALCDISLAKLKERGKQYLVAEDRFYTSFDEMLQNSDIDVVDIVTGPETHLELVRGAAAAGKHIMCQKPFAPSLREAEEMVRIAQEAGVRLMVTENWRWLQPFQTIKRILDEGQLGKLHVARYIHTDYYTPRMMPGARLPQPFFREMPKLLFYEMGAHWFDTWRFLFGTPKRLYAETARISPYIKGEDTGIITLGYDDFYGCLDMSWATRRELDKPPGEEVGPLHREQLSIDGAAGTLKLYTSGRIAIVDREGKEEIIEEKTALDHEESHFRLQSHFIACMNSGEPFQTSGEDNLTTLRMVFGVYESAFRHEPIQIPEG